MRATAEHIPDDSIERARFLACAQLTNQNAGLCMNRMPSAMIPLLNVPARGISANQNGDDAARQLAAKFQLRYTIKI
ncbi:hypothetical protein CSKR_102622 [Clonorchis sinensis]|uniref:Uncharacterized protein n=1 Tax=Clonorchis sinensis TaxID=79923 RepID=A0A419PJV8_CLOSI|nr:hypothetical protein CSKR_102622 [Clonorchis sinensis]